MESKWTRRMRKLFARLRSDHAKELGYYKHKIGKSETPNCKECEVPETIKHVLCECAALSEARHRNWPNGNVTVGMLVTHPEVCRQILEKRFNGLKYPRDERM